MTDTKQKINALFLTAIMVISVFAATIAFSGAAAAANRGAGLTYSTGPTDGNGGGNADSVGQVGDGAVVFQGEEDLEPNGNFGGTDIGQLQKAQGDNSGILLGNPIPQDQPTGTYEGASSTSVTLQTPRITSVEVQNSNEGDVTGSTLQTSSSAPDAFVRADYNFQEAEDLEITVEDEDGLEVTEEIVVSNSTVGSLDNRNNENTDAAGSSGSFDVGWELDTSNVDSGQYTITVEGTEDLTFGDSSETVTVNLTTDQQASLNLDNDEAVQGENLGYTVDESPEGNFHAVVIESDEFGDNISPDNADDIFRNVGDVVDSGVVVNNDTISGFDTTGAAGSLSATSTGANSVGATSNINYTYAIVEVDGGSAAGSIETQYLDDSSIDIDVYQANGIASTYLDGNNDLNSDVVTGSSETDDEVTFEVVEGEVSLDSPSNTYVTGSEVDVEGTASSGADDVAIYARDNDQFQLVTINSQDTISVDGDDTFSEEDVQLSANSDILGLPGNYRLGVITKDDADTDNDGTVEGSLSTSEFNSGVSSTNSIRVLDTALNATFITYNGQVAKEDGSAQIDVEGQAPGANEVIGVFVGPRGEVVAQELSVDDEDTFDEEDIQVGSLSQGVATAHVLSPGRDGNFGASGGTITDAASIEALGASSSTGDQVRERILENSVDDTASDDLIVTETFRVSNSLTTVDSATSPVETNGTIELQGTTNNAPDDTTITVELLDQDSNSVTIESTDEWGQDGQFSVSLDLSDDDVQPGNYTIEADDGDNSDRATVQVVEAGSLEEEPPETETPEPDTETPEPDTETPEPDTETETEMDTEMTTEEETTSESGPGFTAAIALIALVAAALLAVRRNN
jgi:major cell surface glycoprotein (TIGR04216 family)